MEVVLKLVEDFFDRLNKREDVEELLKTYGQVLEFQVKGGEPFHIEIRGGKTTVKRGKSGETSPTSISHFVTDKDTLIKLFEGKIGWYDTICEKVTLEENRLWKGSVLSWVGKIITIGQRPPPIPELYPELKEAIKNAKYQYQPNL